MKKQLLIFIQIICFLLMGQRGMAQDLPFSIQLQEETQLHLPALQAYAFAQYGDYTLLLTGMTSGLHGFRPPDAFPVANANDSIYVLDIADDSLWSAPLTSLPACAAGAARSHQPAVFSGCRSLVPHRRIWLQSHRQWLYYFP